MSGERNADKAMTELMAIYASVTRATGRPPPSPFRNAAVPGWVYYPEEGVVLTAAENERRELEEQAKIIKGDGA